MVVVMTLNDLNHNVGQTPSGTVFDQTTIQTMMCDAKVSGQKSTTSNTEPTADQPTSPTSPFFVPGLLHRKGLDATMTPDGVLTVTTPTNNTLVSHPPGHSYPLLG